MTKYEETYFCIYCGQTIPDFPLIDGDQVYCGELCYWSHIEAKYDSEYQEFKSFLLESN